MFRQRWRQPIKKVFFVFAMPWFLPPKVGEEETGRAKTKKNTALPEAGGGPTGPATDARRAGGGMLAIASRNGGSLDPTPRTVVAAPGGYSHRIEQIGAHDGANSHIQMGPSVGGDSMSPPTELKLTRFAPGGKTRGTGWNTQGVVKQTPP